MQKDKASVPSKRKRVDLASIRQKLDELAQPTPSRTVSPHFDKDLLNVSTADNSAELRQFRQRMLASQTAEQPLRFEATKTTNTKTPRPHKPFPYQKVGKEAAELEIEDFSEILRPHKDAAETFDAGVGNSQLSTTEEEHQKEIKTEIERKTSVGVRKRKDRVTKHQPAVYNFDKEQGVKKKAKSVRQENRTSASNDSLTARARELIKNNNRNLVAGRRVRIPMAIYEENPFACVQVNYRHELNLNGEPVASLDLENPVAVFGVGAKQRRIIKRTGVVSRKTENRPFAKKSLVFDQKLGAQLLALVAANAQSDACDFQELGPGLQAKAIFSNEFNVGFLRVAVGATKETEKTESTEVFFVAAGGSECLKVTLNGKTFLVGTGVSFVVPEANTFELLNVGCKEIELFFVVKL